MQYNPSEFDEILNIFKAESEEIIQEINDNFLMLEKNPENKTPLKRLLQLSHSLKGAARMLGFNGIQNIAHKTEDILSYWNNNNIKINPSLLQPIYETCDYLTVLIDKSVKNKADYTDEETENRLKILDNILKSDAKSEETKRNDVQATKIYNKEEQGKNVIKLDKEKSEEKILKLSTDINAIVLELMFVISKDYEDTEEPYLVVSENLKQLYEIFSDTIYDETANKIKNAILFTEEKGYDSDYSRIIIPEIRDEVHKYLKQTEKENNDSTIKHDKEKKNVQVPQNNSIKEVSEKFDNILKNSEKLKYDKEYIKQTKEFFNEIYKTSEDEKIREILSKTINIFDLFEKKGITADKDSYIVILQCIYAVKRLYFKETSPGTDNIGFLVQRLNLVEDILSVIKNDNTAISVKKASKELLKEDFVNLKSEFNSVDLQEIKTLRVDTVKLDNLVSQTGELLVNGIRTRTHLSELEKINSKVLKWNGESKKVLNYIKYLEKRGFFTQFSDESFLTFYKKIQGFFNDNAEIIGDINTDLTLLYNVMSTDDNKLHQNAIEIDSIAKGIRVLPLATIFHSFPRMMRDIARENNKKIDFIISGSDTTVDKKIIEEIKIPLIHILRNAVSHGIEKPEERKRKNKDEIGKIKLSARQAENYVIITVEDDGCGIDTEKVKEVAVNKGILYKEEADNLSKEQLIKLLFIPGFSTETAVNEISGRGVGLDVVKTKIINLNGEISVDTIVNSGCKITVKLPLTMSTMKVFIITTDEQKYAIPVSTVKYIKKIKASEIYDKNGSKCIFYDSHSIRVFSMSEVLTEKETEYSENELLTIVIIKDKDREAAFIIDKLNTDAEVFQKKLVAPIIKIKNISGFTTLSDGEICLIINTNELLRNILSDDNIQGLVSGYTSKDGRG